VPKVVASSQPPTLSRGSRGHRVSTTLAEINIIPLVDVMLVLLIIFMVTAPMLQRGVEVKLPVAVRSQEIASERLFVDVPLSYQKDQRIFIKKESIRLDFLGERIRQMLQERTDKQVYLRMDARLTIQDQMDVFDRLKAAGVQTVGIPTSLPGEQK
jgi:biopolymer transport protein TolR